MKEKQLAKELRKRQIQYGRVPAEVIKKLSDKEIIDSYITCSECQEKEVSDRVLAQIINKATSVDHFLNILDKIKICAFNHYKKKKFDFLGKEHGMYMENYDEKRKDIIQSILNENGLDTELPESQIPFYMMDQIYDALWQRDEELEFEFMREQEEEIEEFENDKNDDNEDIDDEDDETDGLEYPERN